MGARLYVSTQFQVCVDRWVWLVLKMMDYDITGSKGVNNLYTDSFRSVKGCCRVANH